MGPFRKCTCKADVKLRRRRVESLSVSGRRVGPFTLMIHEPGCLSPKGDNGAAMWLFACKSTDKSAKTIKVTHDGNLYMHPHADHRGKLFPRAGCGTRVSEMVRAGDWDGAFDAFKAALMLPTGAIEGAPWAAFPKTESESTDGPQKVWLVTASITDSHGVDVAPWGIFGSEELAWKHVHSRDGIRWVKLAGPRHLLYGSPADDCDDFFPGMVEAEVTVSQHTVIT